jgi:hypothetical protein
MPESTNLNISPYFDDFDSNKNYHKVLFKPGYPVQARELTTLQSILQNQIEQFGNHVFKEGSVVIPGQLSYTNQYRYVKIENSYLGLDVSVYINDFIGRKITGNESKVQAQILYVLPQNELNNEYTTLYVNYLASGLGDQELFSDNEKLTLDSSYSQNSVLIQSGEGFANTTASATGNGSAAVLSNGIYFLRGFFVEVNDQTLILDPYANNPSYKVGFSIIEETITADEDDSLNDNAKGFSNYAAPGADRFKLSTILSKKELTEVAAENFISLLEVRNGELVKNTTTTSQYNVLSTELARRTSEESGDYYIRPFDVTVKETLNDNLGNNGVFQQNQLTYNNQTPKESLGTYKIGAGKAYVKGYEVESLSANFLDFEKPRTTKTITNASLAYVTGPTFTLNNAFGSPNLNLGNPFIVSLRDSRVGVASSSLPGKEIGLARVYDYALESGSYNTTNLKLNQWDISLFDVETYTEITLNQNITLTTPAHIKGKSSGATGYLRFDVNNAGILTAYGVKGSFAANEKFIFNGIETTSRVSTAITEYTIQDVESLSNVSTSSTSFTADVVQSSIYNVGLASITARSATGISSISLNVGNSNFVFTNNTKVGGLIKYTISGSTVPTYNTIVKVYSNSIVVTGVTTVTGICEGSPPSTANSVSDLSILGSSFQTSTDNTLYTKLPKNFISSVDLTDSNLTIKKEFAVTISSNQSNTLTAGSNETFLPFDEERYVLVRSDGTFETLRPDKFSFDATGSQLTIFGLGANDSGSRLIATLRKIKVKSKVKNKNRIKTLIIAKSKYEHSGIGSTTINDGLTYNTFAYGTRVQDEEICLNVPDVTKLYGVFESTTTSEASLSSVTFSSLTGPTNKTSDLLVGEKFTGGTSGAIAIFTNKVNDLQINYVYLNDKSFQLNEVVTFEESGIQATISAITLSDKNITSDFTLDPSQKNTIYDYSRVVRNPISKEPAKQIKIVFESASFSSSDLGDITTVNSYGNYDYCDIAPVEGKLANSDIIDIRPRVSEYAVTPGSRSPFEFLSRTFSDSQNCGRNILASDESILLSFDYYLGRIDRIFLTKNGGLQLLTGEPSETPRPPKSLDNTLEIGSVSLPPYLCDVSKASISLVSHKRYQMTDISRLEDRIKNLESYTTLNLLEANTQSLSIKDVNGLDRFKSGFFVDNFRTTNFQNKTTTIKNSIDQENQELRPSPYCSEVDLLIGSKSLIGIGSSVDVNADVRFVSDLIGNNVRRTGQVVTLDYTEASFIVQPYATRIENVTPYLVTNYEGTIVLTPSSDVWTDQVRLEPRTITQDNFTATQQQLTSQGFDPQTGLGPVNWNSWQTTWTGQSTSQAIENSGDTTTTFTTTRTTEEQRRTGTQLQLREQETTTSQGDSLISSSLVTFMRSRNIEFVAKRFRPYTQVYSFFDGEDVNSFIVPKLLEISMVSGIFQVGETIVGTFATSSVNQNTTPGSTPTEIRFRVATSNHKYGPFNAPTDVYTNNPYDQQTTGTLTSVYSATSTLLNVDITSLSEQVQGQFFGRVLPGLKLKGLTSGAEATISNVRLVSDNVGTIIGSYLIPNPNVPTNPTFETGIKTFKLTNDKTNSLIIGSVFTEGEVNYYAQGLLNNVKETITSVRSPQFTATSLSDARTQSNSTTSSSSTRVQPVFITNTVIIENTIIVEVPAPAPQQDPLAQSFFLPNGSGLFVTKVDLYFVAKDDTLPVTVQLRPMSLGLPTTNVYPFSEVSIDPKDVNISDDGTVKTTVTFPAPVYLRGGEEHSIVLLSQSTSYQVWICRLGEIDRTTAQLSESQQILVTEQPLLGSLFKSQNASTWTPSQYEDLKFTLYQAVFTNQTGDINFYNPQLSIGNKQIANLLINPLEMNSKKVRVGLGATVTSTNFIVGTTVGQLNSNATGNYVGSAGSCTGSLTITNSGIGYSNGSFNNVSLTNITGSGVNVTANITISANVAVAATIADGGSGYRVGDVLSVSSLGGSTLGSNMRLSVPQITGIKEIILDNVQGTFTTGAGSTITYVASGIGVTSLNGGSVTASYVTVDSEPTDGLHIKVNHKNHGMYALNNNVNISGVYSDKTPTTLNTAYAKESSGNIILTNASGFETFENVSIASTNPGYIQIEDEIIAYEGIVGNTLTGITRQIDQTKSFTYAAGTPVFKYELNSISLRRVNKTHTLQDVGFSSTRIFDLDYYYLKIDTSSADNVAALPQGQVDRSVATSFPPLYINQTKSAGGPNIYATQNIPFEIIRPNIQIMNLLATTVSASIRTVTGSSVDGNEESYMDVGYEPIVLTSNNYLSSPRIVAATINESSALTTLPGNKSFTMNIKMSTIDRNVSPVIDLDRVSAIFISNRVNSAIDDYVTDFRVSTLQDDPSAFVYASSPITLEVPASSLKVIVSAYVNRDSDLRCLYAIMKDPTENPIYYPFPGWNNLDSLGNVINIANNDGLSDVKVTKTDNLANLSQNLNYKEYTFTTNNLTDFRYFSIKLIGSSSDMAHPPRLKDLRVIALA